MIRSIPFLKVSKSQKQFMGSSILPKIERKKIDFTTTYDTSRWIVFVRFFGELKDISKLTDL